MRGRGGIDRIRDGVRAGDKRSLARAITLVENAQPGSEDLIRQLAFDAQAYVIGLTGPPGAGKSTLAHRLATLFATGHKVAILAVDPTSPFTGGAILGDRIRMQDSDQTGHIFIRSMASRGQAGGLARAAADTIRLMAAAGYDLVIVETVGAGQGEVDIMRHADTTVVLLVPNLGDDVQAIKAGILEIGDVFAVNKADLGGAERTVNQLQMVLDLQPDHGYRPPIISVIARDGEGVAELAGAIRAHRHHLETTSENRIRRETAAAAELRAVLAERMLGAVISDPGVKERWNEAIDRLASRRSDPYTEVDAIMRLVDVTAGKGGAIGEADVTGRNRDG